MTAALANQLFEEAPPSIKSFTDLMGEEEMPALSDDLETTPLKNGFIVERLSSSPVHSKQSVQVVVHSRVSPQKRPSSPIDEETRERGSKRRRGSDTQTRSTVHEDDLG